jgi:hypothetical protein
LSSGGLHGRYEHYISVDRAIYLFSHVLFASLYKRFMFDTPLAIDNNGEVVTDPVYKMLQPIKKAKYPDITEVRILQHFINTTHSICI